MRYEVSLHGHSPYSRGRNINQESAVTLQDMALSSKILSTSDHMRTDGHPEIRKLGLPHLYQIEIELPMHIILTGPYETIYGIEKRYNFHALKYRNVEYLRNKDYNAVSSNVLDTLDKVVDGNDKTIALIPHPFDSLGAGIGSKLPADEMLEVMRSRKVHYIESQNGMNSPRANNLNAVVGFLMNKLYGKGIFAGADYHTSAGVGTNLNIIESQDDSEDSLLKALRDYKIVGTWNVKTISEEERIEWFLNRVAASRDDLIQRTYTDNWVKDTKKMEFLRFPGIPSLIRGLANMVYDHPYELYREEWNAAAKVVKGINYLFESFRMVPKYNKFVREAIHGGGADDEINWKLFREDPIKAIELISVAPVAGKQRCG